MLSYIFWLSLQQIHVKGKFVLGRYMISFLRSS
ncbi:MAG: hypothetical protein ACI8QW_001602, partial [Saprospiraceae bacterium]